MSRAREWAARIRSSLAKTVEATVETGLLLADAKAALGHGRFLSLLRDLRLSDDTAQQYLRVAGDLVLANTDNWRYLPASRSALDALTHVDARLKLAAIADGRIHAGMTAADVRRLGATAAPVAPGWDAGQAWAALRSALDSVLQGCSRKDAHRMLSDLADLVQAIQHAYGGELGPDDLDGLLTLRHELADAEPGQLFLQFDDAGKVVGALRQPSTYPRWMGRRTRADADRMIRAIDRLVDGQAAGMLGGRLLEASRRRRDA